VTSEAPTSSKTTYNFYIENSGSVWGFFNGNSTAKNIVKDYYDRIDVAGKTDTITLNYINTQVKPVAKPIDTFLSGMRMADFNAQTTKLDDILSMAMDNANSSNTSLLISDFMLDTPQGSLATAKSGITRLFTKKLQSNSKLSIVIRKYESSFNGKYYYPGTGSINVTNRTFPLYVWAFGPDASMSEYLSLPMQSEADEQLCLQLGRMVNYKINAGVARMLDRNNPTVIYVSPWNATRDRSGGKTYSVSFDVNLKGILTPDDELCKKSNYTVTSTNSSSYQISSIQKQSANTYRITITTSKPSPGALTIAFPMRLPNWVAESNFVGTGLPDDGQTYGIESLIDGVYRAYSDKGKNLFYFEVQFK
jgi:hypothetical protein